MTTTVIIANGVEYIAVAKLTDSRKWYIYIIHNGSWHKSVGEFDLVSDGFAEAAKLLGARDEDEHKHIS